MKKALAALCFTILLLAVAHTASAQDYRNTKEGNYRQSRSYMEDQRSRPSTIIINPDLRPAPSGAGTAIYRKGFQMINPLAPARYGMGSKYLAAAPFPRDAAQDSANEAKYTFGGIKLFGIDF